MRCPSCGWQMRFVIAPPPDTGWADYHVCENQNCKYWGVKF